MMLTGDDELVSSLLFDAEATRGVVSDWRKENTEAMLNRSYKKKSVLRILGFSVYQCHYVRLCSPQIVDEKYGNAMQIEYRT